MAKNDNPNALRLVESISNNCGEDAAATFMKEFSLSKSASIEKKFEWAQNICDYLQEHFDDETVKSIRMDCACGPGLSKCKKLKAIYNKSSNPGEFVDKVNKLNEGYAVEYDGDAFYLIYPECYCPCVKRVDKKLPKIWCYCTLGYTKKMFDFILDCETKVELINSVKMGNENCRIKIMALEV